MNHQYFEAVRLERTVMFFLLFFIVVVAAFGIMSTLITVTVQKRREIGIMKRSERTSRKSSGCSLAREQSSGFFGTLTASGSDDPNPFYRNEFSHWLASTLHIEIFPREVYQFSSIPAEVIRETSRSFVSAPSHLFICSPDPCLFRRAPRSGQSPALRVEECKSITRKKLSTTCELYRDDSLIK